jgi:hypothetical protein
MMRQIFLSYYLDVDIADIKILRSSHFGIKFGMNSRKKKFQETVASNKILAA